MILLNLEIYCKATTKLQTHPKTAKLFKMRAVQQEGDKKSVYLSH